MGKCLQAQHTPLMIISSLGTRTVFYSFLYPPPPPPPWNLPTLVPECLPQAWFIVRTKYLFECIMLKTFIAQHTADFQNLDEIYGQ